MKIKFKKLHPDAICPQKKPGDAGYDLFSLEDYTLIPLERKVFHVQIGMEIPDGYFGRICDRSGKALKDGLHVMAGIIDSTYRGSIGAVLINLNFEPEEYLNSSAVMMPTGEIIGRNVEIKKGDKIAQIIFEKYEDVEFEEVDELSASERGETGFGNSGR